MGISSSASVTGEEITYSAAGPFSEVDQTAAVAAERKVGVGTLHRLSCRWDNEVLRCACGAWRMRLKQCFLQNSGDQIVIVGFGDLATIKLAGLRL